ncbi:MAG TPA: VCBS repeat-containing protein [Solirubrobacterales bacterium]|nr:VCBS repeat-containing protein [Solirubrobacterales bacterium]
MGCRVGFGNLADGRPLWVADFAGSGNTDTLFYTPYDGNWWLGVHDGQALAWSNVGNTLGAFGDIWDGRPFWIGDFDGDGKADVLFYAPADGNWWLGSHDGAKLAWSLAGNTLSTPNFGDIWDGRPFWVGDFSGAGRAEVLFYTPGDGNWWRGSHDGTALVWADDGNTLGANPGDPDLGDIWDGRPFWVGDFDADGQAEVLFYTPGDGNWWLGNHNGSRLSWRPVGNTRGAGSGDPDFGQIWDGRPFWVGDFSGAGRAEVLFYARDDGDWQLGSYNDRLRWSHVGNTPQKLFEIRIFWVGRFDGGSKATLLSHTPGNGNWQLAVHDGANLVWGDVGNTQGASPGDANFGQIWGKCPIFVGDFDGGGRDDVLFYSPDDGSWWCGTRDNGPRLGWRLAGNTGVPTKVVPRKTPWAVLLCRFNDSAIEPIPRQYYERLFTTAGAGTLNMVEFFCHMSHCKLDLSGSQVFGWLTLDKKFGDYKGSGTNKRGRLDLVEWAKQAARRAGVKVDDYFGVVVVLNVPTDLFGGKGFAVCDPLSSHPASIGQEMGHGYGVDHSMLDGSTELYKDRWDTMSTTTETFSAPHPEYQLIGPGLNAWNMRGRGWLDESRVWKHGGERFDETIQLRPLHHRELPWWLAAELPGNFLAEFRVIQDWDGGLLRPAILIHYFNENQSYLVQGGSGGSYDLVAGDTFTADVVSFLGLRHLIKLDIIGIDGANQVATVRVRYRPH